MSSDASVTHWIDEFRRGNRTAAQQLWERYFHRLANLARQKLPERLLRAADEEDVALSAFHSFCRDVEIAAKLDCAPRTVERKLRLIRKCWEPERGS